MTPEEVDPVPTEVPGRKLPCAGCRLPASIDCQHACAYIFGHVNVSEALPLAFNLDKQFSVQIPVLIEGRSREKIGARWNTNRRRWQDARSNHGRRCNRQFSTHRPLILKDELYTFSCLT